MGNKPSQAQRWATVGTGRRNFLPVACLLVFSLRIRLATFVPSACTKADRLEGLFGGAGAETERLGPGPRGDAARELNGVLAPSGHGGLHRGGTADYYHTRTYTLQYKIDSDVRLDGRPCYVQEVREFPEEAARCERLR